MTRVLVEAAIDSILSAERAVSEGADRLEVCDNLDVGGLTPPLELLRACLALGVPCVAMARPRAGNFHYTHDERRLLIEAVEGTRDTGAQGVVFGALAADQSVDDETVDEVVSLCTGIDTVFHRAFDETPNVREALDTLMQCGVTRVLTSGQAATAIGGLDALTALFERAGARIEILPGGGIRAGNVAQLVRRTGTAQVHARGTEPGVIAAIRRALAQH